MRGKGLSEFGFKISAAGWNWVVWEGALPLLGAGVLYILWGIVRWAVSANKKSFALPLKPAIDSLGWLYGAIIVAVQTGIKGLPLQSAGSMPYWAFAGAVICLLVLLAAMGERGQNPQWEPPLTTQFVAAGMVLAILFMGYTTHALLHPEAGQ